MPARRANSTASSRALQTLSPEKPSLPRADEAGESEMMIAARPCVELERIGELIVTTYRRDAWNTMCEAEGAIMDVGVSASLDVHSRCARPDSTARPGLILALVIGMGPFAEPAPASEIIVPTDKPTIQAAVTAALPGDAIKILPGIYKEQITIAKDLTLKGAGIGKTVIQAPSTLTPFGTNEVLGLPAAAVIRITDGASVWMSSFTLTGPIPCSVDTRGILVVKDATLAIKDAHITRIRPSGVSCPPAQATGRGIVVGLVPFVHIDGEPEGGSFGHATITKILIDKYQLGGISILAVPPGPPSTATISKNLVIGGADIKVDGQVGINNTWAIVQITKNVVRGNVCTGALCGDDPFNDFQSAGIGPPFLPSEFTEISENFVSNNDVGIYSGGGPFVIKENLVLNNRLFGIAIQDGDGATERNVISGARVGIAVIAGSADVTGILTKDRISRTSVAKVKEIECCGFNATAIVK